MNNFIFESFITLTDEQKAFFVKTLKEHKMLAEDAKIFQMHDYFKSELLKDIRDAEYGVKADRVRSILTERNAYNSILVVTPYKNESSLVKMMTNESVIIVVTYGKSTSYEFMDKDEYLDMLECNVSYLQEFVPYDGSELDLKLTQYEKLARYMDLPDLYLRDERQLDEPTIHADFITPYGFQTYDGDFDHESRWIEGKKSRKNLLKRTRTPYSKKDVEEKFALVEAVLQFIGEHPEHKDLFDDLDVGIDPETGEKRRMGMNIVDVNPDWIGQDPETGELSYSENFDDEDFE